MFYRSWVALIFFVIVNFTYLKAQSFSVATEEPTDLRGFWQFYPHQLLTGLDLSQPTQDLAWHPITVQVPANWNNYLLADGRPFGSQGAGTYTTWLENLTVGELYAIQLNANTSSYAIFLGDSEKPLCQVGKPALSLTEYTADYGYIICPFQATAQRMRLTIQVANFLHRLGGLSNSPTVGKEQFIRQNYLLQLTFIIFMFALLLGISLRLIPNFFFDYVNRWRNLYLLGLVLSIFIHLLHAYLNLGREIFAYGFETRSKLVVFMPNFGAAMFFLYLTTWLPKNRIQQVVSYASMALVLWAIVLLLAPLSFTVKFYQLSFLLMSSLVLPGFILIGYAFLKNKEQSKKILVLGAIFLAIGITTGTLHHIFQLLKIGNVDLIGLLLFLASQTTFSVAEMTKTKQEQTKLAQEYRAQLNHLKIFLPLQHLKKVSRYWKEPLKVGKFYKTEACLMFLRLEPKLANNLSPEELFQLYNDFSEEIANYVQRVSGVVDRISSGHYILSFNDDPVVALKLAVLLRSQKNRWQELLNIPLNFRCGIHYGPAVWGLFGIAKRWAGGYLGDMVNTTARLETLCARYRTEILMSQDAYFQTAHFDEYLTRMLEPVKLKGKQDHTFVYEVLSGLPEEKLSLYKETLPIFGRGLQAFLIQNFKTAIDFFEKVSTRNPYDYPAKLYLSRSQRLLELKLDESWNPIEILEQK